MTDAGWSNTEKLLAEFELKLGRKLQTAQRDLLERLMEGIASKVKMEGPNVAPGQDLTSLVDEVYQEFYTQGEGRSILEFMVQQVVASSTLNIENFGPDAPRNVNWKSVSDAVQKNIFKSIGLSQTPKGFRLIKGGYLESMSQSQDVLKAVKKEMVNAVFGKKDLRSLTKSLKTVVQGADEKSGVLVKHYKTFAYDTLQQANRIEAQAFATAIGLQAFVYAGNEIDSTRCFCKENLNKVILRSEALELWPDMVGEDCGPIWSKNAGEYKPLEMLGGHECRHQARWITVAQALRLDKTLKYENGQLIRMAA